MSAFQHKSHLQKKPYAVFDFQMAYAKTILISLYHFWNYGGQSFEMDFQSSFFAQTLPWSWPFGCFRRNCCLWSRGWAYLVPNLMMTLYGWDAMHHICHVQIGRKTVSFPFIDLKFPISCLLYCDINYLLKFA